MWDLRTTQHEWRPVHKPASQSWTCLCSGSAGLYTLPAGPSICWNATTAQFLAAAPGVGWSRPMPWAWETPAPCSCARCRCRLISLGHRWFCRRRFEGEDPMIADCCPDSPRNPRSLGNPPVLKNQVLFP